MARFHPVRSVRFDAAAFMALWRYAEAHALQLHNNPSPHAREPEAVFLRAVEAFREASQLAPVGNGRKKSWRRSVDT